MKYFIVIQGLVLFGMTSIVFALKNVLLDQCKAILKKWMYAKCVNANITSANGGWSQGEGAKHTVPLSNPNDTYRTYTEDKMCPQCFLCPFSNFRRKRNFTIIFVCVCFLSHSFFRDCTTPAPTKSWMCPPQRELSIIVYNV